MVEMAQGILGRVLLMVGGIGGPRISSGPPVFGALCSLSDVALSCYNISAPLKCFSLRCSIFSMPGRSPC